MAKSKLKTKTPTWAELAATWQLCRTEEIPDLLYAFDSGEQANTTERIVTYNLEKEQLQMINATIEEMTANGQDFKLLVHLGLRPGYEGQFAPTTPFFQPFLSVFPVGGKDRYVNSHLFTWDPNPRFPTNPVESTESGTDAIPGAGAFLFVHYYLETPHFDLSSIFEATAYQLGRRVRAYIFSVAESKAIGKRIKVHLQGTKPRLSLHLGRGITVATHPVSFRPVLEVGSSGVTKKGVSIFDGGGNDGSDFYDFSMPDPPHSA